MSEVIEILASVPEHIAEGLRTGRLIRYGGEIRVAPGQPKAGAIQHLIRDTFTRDQVLQKIIDPVRNIDANVQAMMGLTQVTAAASVLNLGVSVVGFAVMYYKLDKVQKAVERVGMQIDALGAHLDQRLDRIDLSLVELRYLASLELSQLQEALIRLQEIRGDLFNARVAAVMELADRLARTEPPTDALLAEAQQKLAEVRIWLEQSLGMARLDTDRPELLADLFMRYRLWAMTVALEIHVWRRAGDMARAAELAGAAAERSRLSATHWVQLLMPADEFGGIYRLGHTSFEATVPVEVRARLSRMTSPGDHPTHALRIERERLAAEQVALVRPELPQDWHHTQRLGAQLLDCCEEVTERMESLRFEMDYCNQRRLGFDRWEALESPPGMVLLPVAG